MGSEHRSSSFHGGETEEEGVQKSDSFVMDMEPFSQLVEKDINANSRLTLQRNLSRKGSGRALDKKFNPSTSPKRDDVMLTTSPTATPRGGSSSSSTTSEEPATVMLGPTDHPIVPKVYHHITVTKGTTIAESTLGGRQSSFRRSQQSSAISPRRILLFFATMSSMGTILLIYFTLSMAKVNGGGKALDQ